MTDLTDRDRLAAAFDDLRQQGYIAPIALGWTTDCPSCAEDAVEDIVDEIFGAEGGEPPQWRVQGHAYWYIDRDDHAFLGEMATAKYVEKVHARITTESGADSIPGDSLHNWQARQELIDAWLDDHAHEVAAEDVAERLSTYTKLINPLYINWTGSPYVIVETLRKHGLSVAGVPQYDSVAIEVLPSAR